MDAVTAVKNDHQLLAGLFEQLRTDRRNRGALLAEVRARLTAHSRAEERYVYPAVRRARPDQATEVAHGADEHREAERLLATVESATGDEFDHALAEFVKAVRHHMAEEESQVLPALAGSMSGRQRTALGVKFESNRIRELKRAGIDENLTKEDLYIRAQRAGIAGRSGMSKAELTRALLVAKGRATASIRR
jgi:hemerythrin superfamily protein